MYKDVYQICRSGDYVGTDTFGRRFWPSFDDRVGRVRFCLKSLVGIRELGMSQLH